MTSPLRPSVDRARRLTATPVRLAGVAGAVAGALVLAPLPALAAPAAGPAAAAAPTAYAVHVATARGDGLEPLILRPDPAGAAARGPGAAPGGAPVVRAASAALARGQVRRGWRTDGFRQVGVTWRAGEPDVSVRTRATGEAWTPWTTLEHLHDGPSTAAGEGNGRHATDLRWVGSARDLQLRVRGAHRSLRVVVIDPGTAAPGPAAASAASAAAPSTARPAVVRTASVTTASTVSTAYPASTSARPALRTRAPRPEIRLRRAWGADESWRDGRPRYNTRLDQVHVHHTVNSNDYGRADVAPMIRGIYRYHTQSLGWSDIGYNFLVDRFGRAWEGRAGGWGRKVRGAHTLGFNENSTGVAVIGNFEQVRVPRPARWTLAQLVAWKLDAAGHRPGGTGRVWSHGSDRYPRGTRPRLPRTAGHRDTNETACPGRLLYADLGGIRRAAQKRADRWS